MKNSRILVLFCLPLMTTAIHAQSDPFTGSYTGKGFRPGEKYTEKPSYVIDVTIEKTGDYYMVRWFENGNLSYYGLGIHIDNVLSVSYVSVDKSIYGTVSYKDFKKDKGYLVGAWCIAPMDPEAVGNGKNGMEVLWPK